MRYEMGFIRGFLTPGIVHGDFYMVMGVNTTPHP